MINAPGTSLKDNQFWSEKWPGFVDCGNGVYREPFQWNGRTCNRYKIETRCTHCKSEMLQDRSNSKKNDNSFCSKTCRAEFIANSTLGNKVIKKRDHGRGHHVLVRNPTHKRADKHGLVYEHILVAEQSLGREISKDERVHHINCVKNDNRPENLFVCESDKEHFLVHGSLNDCVEELMKIGVLEFDAKSKKYMVVIKC